MHVHVTKFQCRPIYVQRVSDFPRTKCIYPDALDADDNIVYHCCVIDLQLQPSWIPASAVVRLYTSSVSASYEPLRWNTETGCRIWEKSFGCNLQEIKVGEDMQ